MLPEIQDFLVSELSNLPAGTKYLITQWPKEIDQALFAAMAKYGKLVVDECAGNFECVPNDDEPGEYALTRSTVLTVKDQIK